MSVYDTWKAPETWQDFDELSAVAIPLRSAPSRLPRDLAGNPLPQFPQCQSKIDHDHDMPASTVIDLDPSNFILPPDADLRFRRLVRSYRLHVVGQIGNKVEPAATEGASKNNGSHGLGIEASGDSEDNEMALMSAYKPRWMLWTHCDACF